MLITRVYLLAVTVWSDHMISTFLFTSVTPISPRIPGSLRRSRSFILAPTALLRFFRGVLPFCPAGGERSRRPALAFSNILWSTAGRKEVRRSEDPETCSCILVIPEWDQPITALESHQYRCDLNIWSHCPQGGAIYTYVFVYIYIYTYTENHQNEKEFTHADKIQNKRLITTIFVMQSYLTVF